LIVSICFARGFGRDSFAFGLLELLPLGLFDDQPPLLLDVLPPETNSDGSQRHDSHHRDQDEPAPQPLASEGYLLVDLLKFPFEPIDLQSQSSNPLWSICSALAVRL